MKTEQHAAPSGPVFNSVKEVEASIKVTLTERLSASAAIAARNNW